MSYSPYQPTPHPAHQMVHPHRSSTGHLVTAWILTCLTGGGLLPWAIAATRHKRNTAVIAILNILGVASFIGLIWFVIGAFTFGIVWIICLIMACTSDRQ